MRAASLFSGDWGVLAVCPAYLLEMLLKAKVESSVLETRGAVTSMSLRSAGDVTTTVNDLSIVLTCNHLFSADDLKLVQSTSYAQLLHDDLSRVGRWCSLNGMSLSVGKCGVITFSRKVSPLVEDCTLSRLDEYRDWGLSLIGNLRLALTLKMLSPEREECLALWSGIVAHLTREQW